MAQYMARERAHNPKQPAEPEEMYKQRLYQLARPAFEAYMAEKHAAFVLERFGEHADTRDRLTRERSGFDFKATLAELRRTVVRLGSEGDRQYAQRTLDMARELETASYGGRKEREQARDREQEREQPRERVLTVHQELNSNKQTKLNKAKERWSR